MKHLSLLAAAALGCGLFLASCETISVMSVSEFYTKLNDVKDLSDIEPLKEGQAASIVLTKELGDAYDEAISDWYLCLGHADWVGPDRGTQEAEYLAKEAGATYVLYKKTYLKTVEGPTETTLSYDGKTATTTTEKSERFEHHAYFFVRSAKPTFGPVGLRYSELDQKTRERIKRNTGVLVCVVYKKAPAFYANVVRGDVIIRANGREVLDGESFAAAIKGLKKGDSLALTLYRDGKETETTLKL